MKKYILALCLVLFSLSFIEASPPGSSTYGRPSRERGRIVREPVEVNPRPYYYEGNIIYPSEGRSYRDSSGRIQRERTYTKYPFSRSNVDARYERQRIREQDRTLDEQRQERLDREKSGRSY